MRIGLRSVGEPCWFNILTPEPAAARGFFAELLGWTFSDIGMGHMIHAGGHAIGAIHDLAHPMTPKGTPPLVGMMVKVERADDAAAAARDAGGRARSAFDVGPAGRMSVCHDPTGAELDLWQPNQLPGTDIAEHARGAPTWFELVTTDVDRAVAFYAALLGWTAGDAVAGARVLANARGPVASVRRLDAGETTARWNTYFAVADVDRAAAAATALGGDAGAPAITATRARAVAIRSPQGVPFHVLERELAS